MAPIVEISDKDLDAFNQLGIKYKLREDLEKSVSQIADLDTKNYIRISKEFTNGEYSLNVAPGRLAYNSAVEKAGKGLGVNYRNTSRDYLGREFVGNNDWFDSLKLNLALGNKTLSVRQFNDYLRLLYLGSQNKIKVYDVSGKKIDSKLCEKYLMDIIKVENPWRAEWLDADFKVKDKKLYVNSNHVLDSNGNLIPKNSEPISEDTLMQDKTPGISLDNYVKSSHTEQGLPTKKVKSGDLFYWYPRSDNNSVAWFDASSDGADLNCNWDPSYVNSVLGVRAVRHE